MELHEIEIFIDPDGRVRIEVRGVKGPACLEITQPIEAGLGGEVELREATPEMLEARQDQLNDQSRPSRAR
jgi:hypothetical protein